MYESVTMAYVLNVIFVVLALGVLFGATAGTDRCRWAAYYYGVMQAEARCEPGCSTTSATCDNYNLNSLCHDGTTSRYAPCDFKINVHHDWKGSSTNVVESWWVQDNKNPGNYVLYKDHKEQYVYYMVEDKTKNARSECLSFGVEAFDENEGGEEKVSYIGKVYPEIPKDGKMTAQVIEKTPLTRETCTNKDTGFIGRIWVIVQILVIPA